MALLIVAVAQQISELAEPPLPTEYWLQAAVAPDVLSIGNLAMGATVVV